MKNLNDVAVEYLDYLKYRLIELKNEKAEFFDLGDEESEFNLSKDLDDQIGHIEITIDMISKIVAKEKVPEIIIDLKGGLVRAVYSNTTKDRVHLYLVDWDNIGCEREYLYCLPKYGEPDHIDNENWDIPHLLNLWRKRHMKELDKWDP
jgi:hypothetical protein